jgi:hypothetical protein
VYRLNSATTIDFIGDSSCPRVNKGITKLNRSITKREPRTVRMRTKDKEDIAVE